MSNNRVSFEVNHNEFVWNREEGLFTFDGAPALLFWDSAIELFLNTIEEISGKDVSKTVYQATGYRMGLLVSSYYQGRDDIEQLLKEYSNIYRNAGWGKVEIAGYSSEEKKATIQLKNSWEHRVLHNSENEHASVLLPSHWAGVFAGLFNQNCWYKLVKSQINGDDYDEIEIFQSDITISNNIHALSRQKEQEHILELERKVEERTEELTSLVKELSSPIIPVLEGILILPMVGSYNEDRLVDMIEKALFELSKQQAEFLLIDLTGISHFDTYTTYGIQRLTRAVRLIGGEVCLVGISPELSMSMVKHHLDISGIYTFSTLQNGVEFAIGQKGYELVKK